MPQPVSGYALICLTDIVESPINHIFIFFLGGKANAMQASTAVMTIIILFGNAIFILNFIRGI